MELSSRELQCGGSDVVVFTAVGQCPSICTVCPLSQEAQDAGAVLQHGHCGLSCRFLHSVTGGVAVSAGLRSALTWIESGTM